MNAHESAMFAAAWRRFEAWLPRRLSDEDRAAILEALLGAGESGREPTYAEVLEVVRNNPGSDARNVLAYIEGEWRER